MGKYEPSFTFYDNDEYPVEYRNRVPDNEILNNTVYIALSRIAQRGAVSFPVRVETSTVTKPATQDSLAYIPLRMTLLNEDCRGTSTAPFDGSVVDGTWEIYTPLAVPLDNPRRYESIARGILLHDLGLWSR
jgi:hypothetical protein